MGRNSYDALCLGCKKVIRVLIGDPQYCEECREKENNKK